MATTVTLVHVYVKPEFISSFIDATRLNHEQSVQETGNFRFDILQDAQDPSEFVMYEAYDSDEAAVAHKTTAHYAAWRDTVAPWMARPREGLKHLMLYPSKE